MSFFGVLGVFRVYWGVSNVLGCFECIGVFRIDWGVSNKLGCFECIGVLQINRGVLYIYIYIGVF